MFEKLAAYREGDRLEVKRAQGGLPRSLWETYSAFANSSGGVILLGVEELPDTSLRAVGVKDPNKLLDDFWNTVNNPQKVSENVLTDSDVQALSHDDVTIIQITVPRADRRLRPIYLNDNPKRSFRRNRSGDYLCRYEEIQGMMRDAADQSQDSRPLPRVGIGELDLATVSSYRQRYRLSHNGHAWNELGDSDFLRCIGAAAEAEDGRLHPTVAGLLMFGHDWRIAEELPNYFLDYRQQTSFDERWQDRVVSQGGDWTGNLYDFYFRVYSLMRQALKTPFRLEGILRVDDTPAHKALREALANCLTNASFSERRGVVCLWTENALVLKNPGDFRMDLGQALKGGISDPRNANLLKMFSFIDIGERAGSGIPSIVRNWTASGYERPRWEEEFGPDRTTLVLPLAQSANEREARDETGDKSRRQGPATNGKNIRQAGVMDSKRQRSTARTNGKSPATRTGDKRMENQLKILALARDTGSITTVDVADSLGLGASWSRELLQDLVRKGKLAALGANRNRTYRLVGPEGQGEGAGDA